MKHRRIFLLALVAAMVAALLAAPVSATQPSTDKPADTADAASSDSDAPPQIAEFTRVLMVPLGVDIPYFYQEVTNISGMYIFTLPDGTVYKRIYGAIDDVYGWYVPEGPDNIIYTNSKMIDTADDIILYEDALKNVTPTDILPEREGVDMQTYSGILPPEIGKLSIGQLFGVPLVALSLYCAAGVAVLCIIILIVRAHLRKKNGGAPPENVYYLIDE